MTKIDVPTPHRWESCNHTWVVSSAQHLEDGRREEVHCIKCECPGERWIADGDVDWPTT